MKRRTPRSVERDDLHPVRPIAGRVLADRLQGAGRGVDRIGGERVRLLAGDDHVAPGGIDPEAARLFLRGGATEPGELAGGAVEFDPRSAGV